MVKTGINVGLASLGIPPEIPDIRQLREQGIRYVAAEAASYALGDAEVLKKLPVDEGTRQLLYQQVYDKAVDVMAKELNKALPSPNFTSEDPGPGAISNRHTPRTMRTCTSRCGSSPAMYSKYLHFLAGEPRAQMGGALPA